MCPLLLDAPIGCSFSQSRHKRVEAPGNGRGQCPPWTGGAGMRDPSCVGDLQIVAKPVAKLPRVCTQRPRVDGRRERAFHGRAFLAGIRCRARAAATCPASRSASNAATARPWLVMP